LAILDYKEKFETILNKYQQEKKPVFVDFRELVDNVKLTERATHSIHPYTAKLLPHIPFFFFNNSFFSNKKDKILDPFCGSGTVLLEGKLAGLNPFGCDANPLARLITTVKCNNFNIEKLFFYKDQLKREFSRNNFSIDPTTSTTIDFWFEKHIQRQLKVISNGLNIIEEKKYKEFYTLCFSNCVRKVSNADSRISVPVKINPERYSDTSKHRINYQKKLDELQSVNVIDKFFDIVDQNLKRVQNKLLIDKYKNISKIVSDDSRNLKTLKDNSIDFILTSPPYAGAQKYIRASSLNLYWLGYNNLRELDKVNIGRENYKKEEYKHLKITGIKNADYLLTKIFDINPLRAYIASNYLIEMTDAFKESARVLKKNKHLILIASNNMVCGYEFKTQEYLKEIILNLGFDLICEMVDDIKSYGLMTKRNKTASIITCEHILIFKKYED
jgi:DNA modification methylase